VNSIVAETDAELVVAAVGGDRAAFGLLLSRHRPALVRLCLRLTG
jgi:DNA-directed RNA polymerase specialized sigma24 family protein